MTVSMRHETGSSVLTRTATVLPRYLAVAYTLLVVYASLHPFSGWRDNGISLFVYLQAAWPRYWTAFDIVVNVLAYLPLGFLWASAFRPWRGRLVAVLLALLLGGSLSLLLETTQNFLPSRVASNVDLATNLCGVLLGALTGGRWGAALLDGGRLHALAHRLIGDSAQAHSGLILLAVWLLSQLNPEILLFGNGDLRSLLGEQAAVLAASYAVEHFPWIEAGIAAGNTLAIGLICSCLWRIRPRLLTLLVILLALLMKSFSLTVLASTASVAWATRGSLMGLFVGLLLWLLASPLPYVWRRVLAAMVLMLATVFVNLAPENPYLAASLQAWRQGHFLNFNGLTRLASSVWPFLALPWLMLLRQNLTGERHR
ncbi:MAG: VanZ family protein [Sterolibacterium sp.]|nr:VanZ family protein [Sterolibacterium sp.]